MIKNTQLEIAKKARVIIIVMGLSTLFYYLTSRSVIGPVFKLVFSLSMVSTLFVFPYSAIKNNDFDNKTKRILFIIIVMAIFQTIRSIVWPDPNVKGDNLLTIIGNEWCMFSLLISMFVYLSTSIDTVLYLKKYALFLVLIETILVIAFQIPLDFLVWILIVFIPFYKIGERFVCCLAFSIFIYAAFFDEDTSRTSQVALGIFFLVFFLTKYPIKRKLITLVCLGLICMPLFYVVITLLDSSASIFKSLSEIVLDKTGDQDLANDTRTFLFIELADDLTKNDAWLLGKGVRSSYFSPFFLASTSERADYYYRFNTEVSILHFLLRGGLAFVVFHYGLIVYAIRNAIKKANNRFVLSISILASGWFFVSCFSFLHGYTIQYIGFYILLGCCLSKKWLDMSDSDINRLFYK